MSDLFNSLSNFIFSGRKREREKAVKGDKDIDELNWKENIINSIKMKKTMTKVNTRISAYNNNSNSKRVNDINEDKSVFCPRCSNKKYNNIYLHLHDNNNTNDNQDKPLVRNIDFNHENGGQSQKDIKDITNEKEEIDNESNNDYSDNQSKQKPNKTDEEAIDNKKEDEVIPESHIIPNPNNITNAIQTKVFQFKVSKPNKVYEDNENDVIDDDDYQPKQPPIQNNTFIKKKIFLETTLLYLPIPKWQIELKYNQLIKEIKTKKNFDIITKFTQNEFITCYESMNGYIINNALPINSNSFRTLCNNLHEEVIDYYLSLIQKKNEAKYYKSHIFNSDVYNSIAYYNQLTDFDAADFNLCDVLIIPIKCNSNVNTDNYDNDNEDEDTNYHWCFALIDLPFNEIVYYDLLYNSIELFNKHMKCITNALSAYPLTKDRTFTLNQANIPIQRNVNGNDSGVILCQLVNYITSQRIIDFDHTDIENLRYLMGIEILKGEILL